jgi:hypothetical protein
MATRFALRPFGQVPGGQTPFHFKPSRKQINLLARISLFVRVRRDLNPRPATLEIAALPAELHTQNKVPEKPFGDPYTISKS